MAVFSNGVTQLLGIQYPIIQAGMVWTSGWKLASAVSNAGALGIIGSGSMTPDVLKEHIRSCVAATAAPFGVNIPLLYKNTDEHIRTCVEAGVKIIFTSAGNPAQWTSVLKKEGITVVHVVSSSRFAKKAEDSGCDAVVAEGFEAGGHNGREETTTMVLTPAVCKNVKIPVISAGGIVSGRQMLAAMVMGAGGVQLGTRFVASEEASVHPDFKQRVVDAQEGETLLLLKQLTPVRLLKNGFFDQVMAAERAGATVEALRELLGRGRARQGMFEGNLEDGELEIGQASELVKKIQPAAEIVAEIWEEFKTACSTPLTFIH